MADDEVVDEESEGVDDVAEDGENEHFEEELDDVGDGDAGADSAGAEGEEEEDDNEDAKDKAKGDDVEDDDEADPDDVEEDLDTILRDRIAAGADEDDEDEDEDDNADQPKRTDGQVKPAEEFSCPECFLMVRRSQFSVRRTDCPGGLDGEDCPMKQRFV